MNVSIHLLALLTLGLAGRAACAQTELNNFSTVARGGVATTFVTDYQAIGINPANLGRTGNARVALTIGEFGLGVGSQSLTRSQLEKFVKHADDKLTPADKRTLARAFTSDNVLNINVDATPVAFSVVLPVVGSFAFSSRQRIVSHLAMNKNMAELLFLGKDAPIYPANFNPATAPLISEVLDGTAVQLAAYNEYNVAYGRRIISLPAFKLSGGVGYRYIQGVGVIDIRSENGKLEAYSALSPQFKVKYGAIANNPSFNLQKDTDKLLQPVGRGHGYDLGLAAEVGKMLRLGVSVTDIGNMTWEGNLLTANDQKLRRLKSSGVDSYEFFTELADLFANGTDSLLQYKPADQRRANLPTKLRAGVGLKVGTRLELGLDVTQPLNGVAGNIPDTFYGLGVDVKPLSWIRLSTGISRGAGYGTGFPVGFAIASSFYELGFSTRDLQGLLSDEDQPYGSLAMGFLRLKIGKVKE
ncbi:hypothetical protein J0X19_14990 [Hymenobacter sp. BT186]|uniref:DUF5723 domain-containing protein n=1 Tax=Hymenobacter telluris TaxID=2816474 RepID=A0A939EY12_9BACT|nr:DUF5723 family protein [Hymenobacter telluris]MBO0359266.1 hypothetical protein [Hymenobacter telluris]MBW3375292.1 hypothetical protein [Hymenobacter norwichensis]